MIFELVLLLIALIGSGFFSGIEVAIMSMPQVKVSQLVNEKVKGAKYLQKLKDDPERTLTIILIGNNIANIGGSALATKLAIDLFGNTGVGIATGIMTFLILVFGEISPKAYCNNHAEKVSLRVAKPIHLLGVGIKPLIWFVNLFTGLVTKAIGAPKAEPLVSEDDIKAMVSISQEEGSIHKHEHDIISKVFNLDDTAVKEIMVPRADVYALNKTELIAKVATDFLNSGYSRVPVYEDTVDNIKGVVYAKDLLLALFKGQRDLTLADLMKDPFIVPENKRADHLLREFQRSKVHLAIVVDEYGGFEGVITIEDLIEELVGEIFDEFDEDEPHFKTLSAKNSYLVNASVPVHEFCKRLGIDQLEVEGHNFDTLGGYILAALGKFPDEGELLEVDRLRLVVTKIENHRIIKVKVELLPHPVKKQTPESDKSPEPHGSVIISSNLTEVTDSQESTQ